MVSTIIRSFLATRLCLAPITVIAMQEASPQEAPTVSIVVLVPVGIQTHAAAPVPVRTAPGGASGVPPLLMVRFVEVVRLALPQGELEHLILVRAVINVWVRRRSVLLLQVVIVR